MVETNWRTSPAARALLLAVWAAVAAPLAMVVNLAVFYARLSLAERAAEGSFWGLLDDPLVMPIALPTVIGGALLAWIGSLFTLLRTRLRVTVPIVTTVALLAALAAPLRHPLVDAPFVLVAAWTAEIACRLVSERRARGHAGPPPRGRRPDARLAR